MHIPRILNVTPLNATKQCNDKLLTISDTNTWKQSTQPKPRVIIPVYNQAFSPQLPVQHDETVISKALKADLSESTGFNRIQQTRHGASTSMYSLTFRVRVTTPPQYGQNGTAHAAGTSILSPARGVSLRRHA